MADDWRGARPMMRRPEVAIVTPAAAGRVFADRVAALVSDRSSIALALPGGSAAEVCCPALAGADLDWERIDLFWCDERAVPPTHEDSNYRIASALLLDRIAIDPARVHRMPADAVDLDAAAAAYEHELRRTLGRGALDIVLLGVGEDGHVCSLFPGHPALDEPSRLVAAIRDSPKPPPRRLTLTLPALAGAEIVVVAFGASKAAAVRDALENPASPSPLARAVRGASRTVFLLDEAAAAPPAINPAAAPRADRAATPGEPE